MMYKKIRDNEKAKMYEQKEQLIKLIDEHSETETKIWAYLENMTLREFEVLVTSMRQENNQKYVLYLSEYLSTLECVLFPF